ncbi:hypothetical protein IWQ60_000519 [Tieghemiomyces parasiticus]|uniref:Fork-head domain-containing protein n=1 Tax=Tieghemiomyces parasiticus TaxID=78921 RepID=A0A9W8DZ44_9FUNG|nr:hypothetical protein IWQ60_000519 [Tieghemiomyces parasiticus]
MSFDRRILANPAMISYVKAVPSLGPNTYPTPGSPAASVVDAPMTPSHAVRRTASTGPGNCFSPPESAHLLLHPPSAPYPRQGVPSQMTTPQRVLTRSFSYDRFAGTPPYTVSPLPCLVSMPNAPLAYPPYLTPESIPAKGSARKRTRQEAFGPHAKPLPATESTPQGTPIHGVPVASPLSGKSHSHTGPLATPNTANPTPSKATRPRETYSVLIARAILASPMHMARLSTIYRWISDAYPYFGSAESQGWQNSVRHNLSLNKSFIRIPADHLSTGGGKGDYWTIHPSHLDKFRHLMSPATGPPYAPPVYLARPPSPFYSPGSPIAYPMHHPYPLPSTKPHFAPSGLLSSDTTPLRDHPAAGRFYLNALTPGFSPSRGPVHHPAYYETPTKPSTARTGLVARYGLGAPPVMLPLHRTQPTATHRVDDAIPETPTAKRARKPVSPFPSAAASPVATPLLSPRTVPSASSQPQTPTLSPSSVISPLPTRTASPVSSFTIQSLLN